MNKIYTFLIHLYAKLYTCINQFKISNNKNIKIALCCIAKCENDYIKEFIDYYRDLGVDKIFIYDNNDTSGEYIENVLEEEDKILCEIINYRGKKICQLTAYQECYTKYKYEYDWFLFFDCDEFLTFTHQKTIKEFLSLNKFKRQHIIHINWMCYGDNNLITNDGRKVTERFSNPIYPLDFKRQYNFPENNHVKSIVRGNLSCINWSCTPHTPISHFLSCCNPSGIKCDANSPFCKYDFNVAYIRHYLTKTIEEWITIKQRRGYPDQYKHEYEKKLNIKEFFKVNRWSKDKQKIIDTFKEKK